MHDNAEGGDDVAKWMSSFHEAFRYIPCHHSTSPFLLRYRCLIGDFTIICSLEGLGGICGRSEREC